MAAIVLETDADEGRLAQNLCLIYPPYFDQRLNLLLPEHSTALAGWIKENRLEMVVIDHLSRTHELEPRELHRASAEALGIARECSASLSFAHHDRKKAQATKGRDQDASLGSALFRADCRLSMHIFEVDENVLCLFFEKSTARRRPDPIWLRQVEEKGGVLEVTAAPQKRTEQKKANKARLLDLIAESGDQGIAPAALDGEFDVEADTLSRYARELEKDGKIRRSGKTDNVRWIAIPKLPGEKSRTEDARQSG